jgi:hypothetical protein
MLIYFKKVLLKAKKLFDEIKDNKIKKSHDKFMILLDEDF